MAMHDTPSTSRRSVLKAGSVGVFAAAFLAACSDGEPVGISGTPAPATSEPPPVRDREPTEAELAEVQIQLHTLASVEHAVADTYADHASRITDPRLAPLVGRAEDEHRSAAAALVALTDDRQDPGPNEHLQTEVIDPAVQALVTPENVQVLLRNLESSLTATYIAAVQTMLEPSLSQTLMTHGGATARRVTALSNGTVPAGAMFPSTDLISNEAYLGQAVEGEGGEGEEEAAAE